MQLVTIPKAVKVSLKGTNDRGEIVDVDSKVSFQDFLKATCEGFAGFAKGPKMARQYDKIMDVIESMNGEGAIQFEDADFEVLKSAVSAAEWRHPQVNRAYIPFYDAVEAAEKVSPKPEKKKKE